MLHTSQLAPLIGEVLPLADACPTHEKLAGKAYRQEKIVLAMKI